MGQHGFARDMEFLMVSQEEQSIWFELLANEDTKKVYPFLFSLKIGYRLNGNSVEVIWQVNNQDELNNMYFSIGAHPAFLCPWAEEGKKYALGFKGADKGVYRFLNKDGLLMDKQYEMEIIQGQKVMDYDFFNESAYVFEDGQFSEVSLINEEGLAYVTVQFDAPVVGIWSPEGKHAPFVCIEPWYGRCDRQDYSGTLEEREWGNCLEPKGVFEKSYTISFGGKKE